MTPSYRHILFAVVLTIGSTMFALSRGSDSANDEMAARKADYIFMEAMKQRVDGNFDSFLELCDYAYNLNPSDLFLGNVSGLKSIYADKTDSSMVARGLKLIGDYVASAPDDYEANVYYAGLLNAFKQGDRSIAEWEKICRNFPDRNDAALALAVMLISTGRRDNMTRAMDLYNELESRNGTDLDLVARKMQLYNSLGDTMSVKAEVRKLVDSNPMSAELQTYAGTVYMQMGERDSALSYFDRAIEIDPANGAASFYRATYFHHIGDSVAYDREVFNALSKSDLDVEPKLAILRDYVVTLYTDTLQHKRIDDMFRSLTDQYPHDAQVREMYSSYLITVKDFPRAIEQIEYQLAADPADSDKWVNLGSLHFVTENYDAAAATALEALHYFPDSTRFVLLYGSALIQAEKYKKANDFLEKYIIKLSADTTGVNDNELSDLWCQKGDILYRIHEIDSAFVSYENALDYNPENMLALNNCAYYMACENIDLPRALKMIEIVVDNDPEAVNSLDTYAWVLFKLKQFDRAREVIDGAMENEESPSSEVLDHAGDIYFMNGLSDEALKLWKQALELDSTNEDLKWKVKNKTIKMN